MVTDLEGKVAETDVLGTVILCLLRLVGRVVDFREGHELGLFEQKGIQTG